MLIYRGLDEIPETLRSRSLAIGVFDGVHRGHAKILEALRASVKPRELDSSLVLTFQPHPLSLIRPESAPGLLFTLEERLRLLGSLGIDEALVLPFTRELAARSYEDFTREILLGRLGMRRLIAGYDFHLGAGRTGTAEAMTSLGEKLGFRVQVVTPIYAEGQLISSTTIRRDLAAGDMGAVTRMLGHPFRISGRVVHGQGRGRALGFPTANLEPISTEKLLPPRGVYRVLARWDEGESRQGLLNLGRAPTLRDRFVAEVHLAGFRGDLYGKFLELDVLQWVREERRFSDPESLSRQISEDLQILEEPPSPQDLNT